MIHSLFIINSSGWAFFFFYYLYVTCFVFMFFEIKKQCNNMFYFYRDVFMEKHWKSVVSRSVCDYFFEQQRKINNPEDIPPVIATPHYYLISIYRSNMYFVAVCMTEGKFFIYFFFFKRDF